jgi:hypothetical protein
LRDRADGPFGQQAQVAQHHSPPRNLHCSKSFFEPLTSVQGW